MKKKMIIALSLGVLFGGAFAVGAANKDGGNEGKKQVNQTVETKSILTTEEIKIIAFQEVDGIIEEIELDKKANQTVYEVEVEKDGIDYELYIDAYSGEVISVDRDDDDFDEYYNKLNNKNVISKADAIAIAEKTVNGKVKEIEKEEDDGFIKYEVELKTDRGEAEVEIDAFTGNVLDVEWDD